MTESLGLGAALWSPLGGGLLTGKYRGSAEGRLSDLGMVIHTESTGRKSAVVGRLPRRPRRPADRRAVHQYTRLTDVGAVPLGVPHEGIAASPDRLQGGGTARITAPAVPVA
ncbi:hypothetical protein [Streptomyces sp. NPDC047939]|uniref:hypothetical protein n=1 Tax=unclassified Streptomyces TaxID=2593676 RepID=UPI00341E1B55